MSKELFDTGMSFYSQGKYAQAIECFDKILVKDTKHDWAWLMRGVAKRWLDRYEEAIQDSNEAIRLNPKNDYAWQARAEAKRLSGRYEDAIQDLNEALRLNPTSDSAWSTRGDAKRMLGRYQESIDDCDVAIKLNPKNYYAWEGRGAAKRRLERYEEAIQDLNEALRLNPTNDFSWSARGAAKRILGRYEEAIQDQSEAIKLNSKSGFAWQERGAAKRRLERYEEAICDYDEVIKLNPKSNFALVQRGLVWFLLGRYEESSRACDEGLKLNPKDAWARGLKGAVRQMQGYNKEAISDCDEALKLDPGLDFVWFARGAAKKRLGRHQEAAQDLKQAISVCMTFNFKDAFELSVQGAAHFLLEDYQVGIRDLEESLKLNPDCDFARKQLAATKDPQNNLKFMASEHYKNSEYAETISCCDRALVSDPSDVSMLQLRGGSKLKLNCCEEAIQDFMEVVKLNPENEYAKECLKEARRKLKGESQTSTPVLNHPEVQQSPVFTHTITFSMAIPKEQLTLEQKLGEGSFGEVYKGVWSPTSLFKIPVAIKKLKNTSLSVKSLGEFRREVEVQAKLDSTGVVKLLGITSEQPYCMVMEFMDQGSLRDLLDRQKPEEILWSVRIQMAVNMAKGLAYLHSNDPIVIHGDLKSLNILVNANGEAKLADFGLAALKTETRSREYVGGNAVKNKGPKGSLLWLAPELFRMNAKRTTATDIFSFAVVLWELASHLFPYESAEGNESLIKDWVTRGERETFDERTPNTPKQYSDLAQRCWDAKPENRFSAQNVVVELEELYSKTQLAPTLFSSSSKLSPTPPRRQSMNSGGYMANTGSGPVPVKSSSGYLVKSVVPSSQSPTASPKVPPRKSVTGSRGSLQSTASSPTASPQVPSKSSPYMGNVYK